MRLGGHMFAAIWIAVASWHRDAMLRLIVFGAGIALLGFSLAAPFVPALLLFPAALFVMAWFCAIGWKDGATSCTA